MLDRENACPLLIVSPQGGMGIEDIDSSLILKLPLDPN
jgi:succinyl-CoA synthetase beta subunit